MVVTIVYSLGKCQCQTCTNLNNNTTMYYKIHISRFKPLIWFMIHLECQLLIYLCFDAIGHSLIKCHLREIYNYSVSYFSLNMCPWKKNGIGSYRSFYMILRCTYVVRRQFLYLTICMWHNVDIWILMIVVPKFMRPRSCLNC